jgi:hypothetical protein
MAPTAAMSFADESRMRFKLSGFEAQIASSWARRSSAIHARTCGSFSRRRRRYVDNPAPAAALSRVAFASLAIISKANFTLAGTMGF